MKKFFTLIFALCILVCSCSKEPLNTEPEMVTISFEQQMVTGNSMVRSGSNEFLDIISEMTPNIVDITLTHKEYRNKYTCKSNETITIPIGEYWIDAEAGYDKTVTHGYSNGIGGYYTWFEYKYPAICYNSVISIEKDKNIILNMEYDCTCVISKINDGKCYSYLSRWESLNGHKAELRTYSDYYVMFFNTKKCCDRDVRFSIEVDPNPETMSVIDIDAGKMELGKYYVLCPRKIESSDTGFDMQYNLMTEGEI